MLKSKFENKGKFKATKIFTDRKEPSKVFETSIDEYFNCKFEKKIIVFYGIGGIGKTKFLQELYNNNSEINNNKHSFIKIFLSLDAYDFSNPITILLSIRKQLGYDCELFDYALLQYFTKIGSTVAESVKKIGEIKSPIFNILGDLISLGMGDVSIPMRYMKNLSEKIKKSKFNRKHNDLINELKELTEFDIYERLPYYLSMGINDLNKKNIKVIIFIDAYESMIIKLNNSAVREDSEEWIKELFISSENLLMIIGCREKIRWYEHDDEWNIYFDQHILEKLSDEDSNYFLQLVPIEDDSIITSIIDTAKGIPLYLDMCVDLYEHNKNNNVDNSHEFFKIPLNNIIDRYMRHLSSQEIYAVEVLALLNYFETDFVEFLLVQYNIAINNKELKSFLSKSIFVYIDDMNQLIKIDESVRAHIVYDNKEKLTNKLINSLIDYLINENKIIDNLYIQYFEQIIYLISIESNNEDSIEKIIDLINNLIDFGYSQEINQIIECYLKNKAAPYDSIYYYTKLRYYRRTSKLQEGIELINTITFNEDNLGLHKYYFEFLKIHLMHLTGHYDYALIEYEKLRNKMKMLNGFVNLYSTNIITIKYADLLMLKGNFTKAITIIDEVLNQKDLIESSKAEAMRVKGHIFRFNLKFDEANLIYQSILEMFGNQNNLNFSGKIYNNLAETNCYLNPKQAIIYAKKSIEINEKINSDIELGKTYAALSIAHSVLGNKKEAIESAVTSSLIQDKTGYLSGVLFGEIAKYIAYLRFYTEEENSIIEISEKAIKLMETLNVYQFKMIFINKNNLVEVESMCNWLDFPQTQNTLNEFWSNLWRK